MAEEHFFGYSISAPLKALYKAKDERKKSHYLYREFQDSRWKKLFLCTSQETPDVIALSAFNATKTL